MTSVLEDLEAELGPEKPKGKAKSTKPSNGHSGESWYALVNAISVVEVLDWLGIERNDEGHVKCPKCGNYDSSSAVVDGGVKCLHDTCAGDGPTGKPGFRTNVDLTILVHGVDKLDAVKELAERFRVELPRSQPARKTGDGATQPLWDDGNVKDDALKQDFFEGAIEDLERSTLACIERRKSGTEKPVLTPFREFNIALEGGFWPGLHTFVGGTGSWKTELAAATCSQGIDDGTAVIYVSLELEKEQVYVRIAARRAGIPWSKIWLGRYTDQELDKIKIEAAAMRGKPFRVVEGTAGGWSSSNLYEIVQRARKSHPTGPLLVVLDFLQLVGANAGEHVELREKIGSTAYVGRQAAREFGASIILVSSTARDKYSLLSSALKEAGLSTMKGQFGGVVKTILNPHVLVGLGKESGEIEFACDSLTVMAKWPARADNGDRLLVLAVAKLRYGHESWCVLAVQGGTQLVEYPCESIDDLPEVADRKGGKEEVAEDEYVRRVLETVRANPGKLKSSNDVRRRTKGDAPSVRDAFKRALRDGLLTELKDGTLAAEESHL